ncbi:SGNH/GDSL hydrolase family protein [Parafilimonas terrae]|uniref:Lysophospholipase L1 n=1 Tax=Parafilimonas terrae TaxID=1465490 RepID=A0A1I5TQY9_9BACT|nr:SGNH/GDSL hydrolase family protein [Parafilimonas terrae]SFP84756.1 Lysophospholipase L1 [Parafilimonas terrae]
MSSINNRRQFLRNATLAGIAASAIPSALKASAFNKTNKIQLKTNDIILFQGDSITDAGRKKTDMDANDASALGSGYAHLAAADLLYQFPSLNLKTYNKGISGNKVYQLAERWDADCLQIKPTVLSILVGVNDFWHTLVNGYTGTLETYKNDYKALLKRTVDALPNVKLIIGEPYALKDVKAVDDKWFPAFDGYRQAAKEIAAEFNALFIPYQSVYEKALKLAPASYWTADGVHPSVAGTQLMAAAWMQTIKS